jgi:hypothetical protein
LIDLGIRAISKAKASKEFLQKPNSVAVMEQSIKDLRILLSTKMASSGNGKAVPMASPTQTSAGPVSVDADAQPAQRSASDEGGPE